MCCNARLDPGLAPKRNGQVNLWLPIGMEQKVPYVLMLRQLSMDRVEKNCVEKCETILKKMEANIRISGQDVLTQISRFFTEEIST